MRSFRNPVENFLTTVKSHDFKMGNIIASNKFGDSIRYLKNESEESIYIDIEAIQEYDIHAKKLPVQRVVS